MSTLILPPRYTPDTIAVGRAAAADGWTVERLANWRVPDWLRGEGGVLYGEPLFATVVARDLGVSLLEPLVNWLPTLPAHYRRRDVRLATLGEARQLNYSAFVKPAEEKCFPPAVIGNGSELPGDDVLPGERPVLIAEPVRWEVEFRCFVLDRKVTTVSVYFRDGQLAQGPDGEWTDHRKEAAYEYAASLCADPSVAIPAAVVVDVGWIDGRGWAVVEANAAWGSGIYGCDPQAVLRVVRRSCVLNGQLTADDQPWVMSWPAD